MNDEQWKKILGRYQNLMYMIAHRIGGDPVTHDFDDCLQELALSAMDAVRTFEKNVGKGFDKFWGSIEFDKYIKTCLWNSKNSKGAKITKKYPITKGVASISMNEEVLLIEDSAGASAESNIRMEEIPTLLSNAQQEVLEKLVEDPTYVKPSGKVNVQALAQDMGKSWYDTRTILSEIAQQLENEL